MASTSTDCPAVAVAPPEAFAVAEVEGDAEAGCVPLVAAAASFPPNILDIIEPKILISVSFRTQPVRMSSLSSATTRII
jgi:hypothetical protein